MRQSSNNSFSTSTNIRFGAKEFPHLWWNVHSVEIPSISMDTPRANGRAGAMATMASDTCVFTDLVVELSIDKDWKTYKEVYRYFLEGLNLEKGTFSHFKKFETWVEFVDGKGETQEKFWFHSCRLMDFGGITVTPNDADDTLQTLTMTFSIMYYSHEENTGNLEDRPRYANEIPLGRPEPR